MLAQADLEPCSLVLVGSGDLGILPGTVRTVVDFGRGVDWLAILAKGDTEPGGRLVHGIGPLLQQL